MVLMQANHPQRCSYKPPAWYRIPAYKSMEAGSNPLAIRTCPMCRHPRSASDFQKRGRSKARNWCKPCRLRDNNLRNMYGIDGMGELMKRLKNQDSKCMICKKALSFERSRDMHVDHCHSCNQLRAILCGLCNNGLGCFRETPIYLRRAAEYAEFHAGHCK